MGNQGSSSAPDLSDATIETTACAASRYAARKARISIDALTFSPRHGLMRPPESSGCPRKAVVCLLEDRTDAATVAIADQ